MKLITGQNNYLEDTIRVNYPDGPEIYKAIEAMPAQGGIDTSDATATAWRIPSSGTISSIASMWNNEMLSGTGGTFTGNPDINTTYYGAW